MINTKFVNGVFLRIVNECGVKRGKNYKLSKITDVSYKNYFYSIRNSVCPYAVDFYDSSESE